MLRDGFDDVDRGGDGEPIAVFEVGGRDADEVGEERGDLTLGRDEGLHERLEDLWGGELAVAGEDGVGAFADDGDDAEDVAHVESAEWVFGAGDGDGGWGVEDGVDCGLRGSLGHGVGRLRASVVGYHGVCVGR